MRLFRSAGAAWLLAAGLALEGLAARCEAAAEGLPLAAGATLAAGVLDADPPQATSAPTSSSTGERRAAWFGIL